MWGTFDILHKGHQASFKEASTLGNLHIILIPDYRIKEAKNIINNENKRKNNLLKVKLIKEVFIDCLPDFQCFENIEPHIFAIGYDQKTEWEDKLKLYLKNNFPNCKIITLRKHGKIHSSHLMGK